MAGIHLTAEGRELTRIRLNLVESGEERILNLQQCSLSETELQYIAAKNIESVTVVKLGNNNLSSQAMRHLSKCTWNNLASIYLTSNKISNTGCKFLTKGPWKHLRNLHLFNNQIGAIGAIHLSKGQWRVLELLNLNCNKINGGIDAILKGNWTSLKRLYLRANYIDYLVLKRILEGVFPCLIGLWLTHNLQNDDERNEMTQWIGQKCKKLTQLIIWE